MAVNKISINLMARLMLGEEISEDENAVKVLDRYIQVCYILTMIIINIPGQKLQEWLAKPITYLFRRRKQRVVDQIHGIVEKRRYRRSHFPKDGKPGFDMIELAIDFLDSNDIGPDKYAPPQLPQELVHNIMAGNTGVVIFVTQMLFQVLDCPEYLEPLRQEAYMAIKEFGWTEKMVDSLPLQDSFLRETNRVYPLLAGALSSTIFQGCILTSLQSIAIAWYKGDRWSL